MPIFKLISIVSDRNEWIFHDPVGVGREKLEIGCDALVSIGGQTFIFLFCFFELIHCDSLRVREYGTRVIG